MATLQKSIVIVCVVVYTHFFNPQQNGEGESEQLIIYKTKVYFQSNLTDLGMILWFVIHELS